MPNTLDNGQRPMLLISGRALLIILAALMVFSAAGFLTGWHYGGLEAQNRIILREISQIQNGLREDIADLRVRTTVQGDSLAALWRCSISLAHKVNRK
jgi:hypothetical protein